MQAAAAPASQPVPAAAAPIHAPADGKQSPTQEDKVSAKAQVVFESCWRRLEEKLKDVRLHLTTAPCCRNRQLHVLPVVLNSNMWFLPCLTCTSWTWIFAAAAALTINPEVARLCTGSFSATAYA